MAYKVIANFKDKTDNGKEYTKGGSYSHEDEKRIAFLIKKGFLEEQPTDENTGIKHTGGGWYELPNGEKVKGKEEAENALKEL